MKYLLLLLTLLVAPAHAIPINWNELAAVGRNVTMHIVDDPAGGQWVWYRLQIQFGPTATPMSFCYAAKIKDGRFESGETTLLTFMIAHMALPNTHPPVAQTDAWCYP